MDLVQNYLNKKKSNKRNIINKYAKKKKIAHFRSFHNHIMFLNKLLINNTHIKYVLTFRFYFIIYINIILLGENKKKKINLKFTLSTQYNIM